MDNEEMTWWVNPLTNQLFCETTVNGKPMKVAAFLHPSVELEMNRIVDYLEECKQ